MRTPPATPSDPPGTTRPIQSIERAAAVLEVVARAGGAASLKDVAAHTGLGKTTAHNILKTLDQLGYVMRRVGDTRYHLGGRILNLSRIVGDDSSLRLRLRPALETIAQRTGETVYLAVPSGDETYYLDTIESSQNLRTTCRIGERERLEGSAVGLIFLAFMPGLGPRVLATRTGALGPDIRSRIAQVERLGFAVDLATYQPGLHCVAAPWREGGEVRAAVGLSGPSARLPRDRLTEIGAQIMKTVSTA